MKMGIRAVGLEINRTYLEVGLRRMGINRPELIIADGENVPFKNGMFDGVLGFDAFHHIPNRQRAMSQFAQALRPGGVVVLVEPGGDHGPDEYSREIMKKYGTLEIGMNLSDVNSYIEREPRLTSARQIYLYPVSTDDRRETVDMSDLHDRSFTGWCVYVIDRAP